MMFLEEVVSHLVGVDRDNLAGAHAEHHNDCIAHLDKAEEHKSAIDDLLTRMQGDCPHLVPNPHDLHHDDCAAHIDKAKQSRSSVEDLLKKMQQDFPNLQT